MTLKELQEISLSLGRNETGQEAARQLALDYAQGQNSMAMVIAWYNRLNNACSP